MADKKISALTAAATPLDGTEVLPIVQSGATVKVANNDLRPKQIQSNATSGVLQVVGPAAAATRVATVPDANFTVARTDAAQSFTGDQTLSTGNLIIGTSGKGIDFSITTHPAGMTSELLSDYEEGTFTATLTSQTPPTTPPTVTARYTKIGRTVNVAMSFVFVNTSGGSGAMVITGLPFTAINDATAAPVFYNMNFTNVPVAYVGNTTTAIYFGDLVSGGSLTDLAITAGAGKYVYVSATYTT